MSPSPEQACARLRQAQRSLQLSTVGEGGVPHCGYTPFVDDGLDLIIFVSQLAVHTRDLLARPTASVMVIADEQDSTQIFARTRVTYACAATAIERDSDDWTLLIDRYRERHGKMVDLLRELPDFVLFRLTPQSGQFVMGFGKAYRLEGEKLDKFVHARSA